MLDVRVTSVDGSGGLVLLGAVALVFLFGFLSI